MILEVNNLHKRFANFTALHDVSLSVDKHEVVGFLGPNGAGKSTTMKILSGFLKPSSGHARIQGKDVVTDSIACRRLIGYLPQDLPLYPDMKVAAYLDHVARLKAIPANQRRHEVVRVMDRCDIMPVEKRHIHKLSGGNRQRVGLAQALLGKPELLIMDEPTAGLDPAQIANFRDIIADLASEHSILLSTHILSEVQACCSRVVMINEGRNLISESVDELLARTRQLSRLRLRFADLGHCSAFQELPLFTSSDRQPQNASDGSEVSFHAADGERDALLSAATSVGGLREVHEERLSLEDVFRGLIATETVASS